MKNNLPPDNNRVFASGENGVIKTEKQLLIEAEKKIGEMEKERIAGMNHIENLKWLLASARSGVAALAIHHGHTPEDVKKIYDEYCERESAKIAEQTAAAKAKFMEDLKAGKVPDSFQAMSREVPKAPEGAPDTEAKPEDNP